MRKINWMIVLISVILLIFGGYLAYDSYFKLPTEVIQNPEDPDNPAVNGKFNVLLLGLDGRKGVNDRADTIIIASLDSKTHEAELLSIPRDTRVKIKGAWDKMNAAYAYGGLSLTKETINNFLGIKIDRYAIIDFVSLVKVVDQVGGIEVDVPVRMYVPLEGIDLQAGKQHLNGQQVLAYTRFRGTSEGDIGRAKRQQEVIQILADKVLQGGNLSQVPHLVDIIKENVETDMTAKEMIALARIASDVLDKGISSKVLPGKNKKIDGLWYWEPDLTTAQSLMAVPEHAKVAVSPELEKKS